MADNNIRLAELLREANDLLQTTSSAASSSTRTLAGAVSNAASMMAASSQSGTFSRLNQSERLRVSNTTVGRTGSGGDGVVPIRGRERGRGRGRGAERYHPLYNQSQKKVHMVWRTREIIITLVPRKIE